MSFVTLAPPLALPPINRKRIEDEDRQITHNVCEGSRWQEAELNGQELCIYEGSRQPVMETSGGGDNKNQGELPFVSY